MATHYLGMVLSVPVYLLLAALIHLSWNGSQRAEYLADYLGSRVSGTREFVSLHERKSVLAYYSHDLFDKTKLHASAPEKIVPDFVSRFTTIPPREMDRVRRINRSELLTLDVTHPPTYLRCRMLEAFPCPPEFSLTEEQSEELNTEVATFDGVVGNAAINQYLPRL